MKSYKYIFGKNNRNYEKIGGKGEALSKLSMGGFNIPEWFTVSTDGFFDSLTNEERELYNNGDIESFKKSIDNFRVNIEIEKEIIEAAGIFCDDDVFAVRSSANGEDGTENSYAGQYETYLFIEKSILIENIRRVWLSAFSERVLIYRKENNLHGRPPVPAVLVQKMVRATSAGVAFGCDPVGGDIKKSVISAVYGLGSALVDGEASADTYHIIGQKDIVFREIAEKDISHIGTADGVKTVSVSEEQRKQQVLTDSQILQVAQLVYKASRFFHRYQDIEWAFDGDELFLLQSRPITSLGKIQSQTGEFNLWDNSNIAESYGGVTTPLTFSFIRNVYREVYYQMCIIFRVPKDVIESNSLVFKRMLGSVNGRVYYNLLSWYKVLSMLPGYAFNRKFMEQMMGVKQELKDKIEDMPNSASTTEKLLDFVRLLNSIFGLLTSFFTLERKIKRFYNRLDDALMCRDIGNMSLDELAGYYYELESKLLKKWDAPLENDFFAMIFYGVLRSFNTNLHNDLLCGDGEIISSEPAKRVKKMAETVCSDEILVNALCSAESWEIKKYIEKNSKFKDEIDEYLAKFGDRCMDELKLESITLHEDSLPLYRAIGAFAKKLKEGKVNTEINEKEIRENAERKAKSLLKGKLIKSLLFGKVLTNARRLVRNRENLRFERTRVFARVRDIFLEIGMRLASLGVIEAHRDIFYLEQEEILGFIDGTGTTKFLKRLINLRKTEYDEHNQSVSPDDRFETRGAVNIGNSYSTYGKDEVKMDGESLKGLGCCPGIVSGVVRVIKDPKGAQIGQGEILVAERTDPGWIMLFPASAGILVEKGSLLSHSAIVAREMGIPAIVSLHGLTGWLKDGDRVTFDGTTGIVTKC